MTFGFYFTVLHYCRKQDHSKKREKQKLPTVYSSIAHIILTPGSSNIYFISTSLQNTYWCIGNTVDYKIAPSFQYLAQKRNDTNALWAKIRINGRKIYSQYSNLPLSVLGQILSEKKINTKLKTTRQFSTLQIQDKRERLNLLNSFKKAINTDS